MAEGISDDILTRLSKFNQIKVISRQSSFQFKNSNLPPQEIGKTLNVNYLLLGKLQQSGDQYKVNVELVDSKSGQLVWAESFLQPSNTLFELQNLIANWVGNNLRHTLNTKEITAVNQNPTANPEAYQAYLKGRFHFYQTQPEDLELAVHYFENAIRLDPTFKLATGWLAWTYCSQAGSWGNQGTEEMYEKTINLLKEIEQEPDLKSMYYKIMGWL